MASKIDQRRLRDGAIGFQVPTGGGELAELRRRREQLFDAVLAMQSLDDLGSVEANNAADRDMQDLQRRLCSVEKQIAAQESAS